MQLHQRLLLLHFMLSYLVECLGYEALVQAPQVARRFVEVQALSKVTGLSVMGRRHIQLFQYALGYLEH